MASVFDLINGSYITIFNRAADPAGATFWSQNLGFANINAAAAAQIPPGDFTLADQLGRNFYVAAGTVFDGLYPTTILDSEFINRVYINLGNSPADAAGAAFWGNRLTFLEGQNPGQVARAIVASEIALTLQTFDPTGQPQEAIDRSATYKNKIAVSQAVAGTGNPSFNPASQSLTDPAYAGETNILIGINATDASRTVALSQVAAANAANDPSLMVGQFQTEFNLTPGVDTFEATAAGAVFNAAPALSPLGINNNTLNTLDKLSDTKNDGTLNVITINPSILGGNPALATGVTISGVTTLNITGATGVTSGFEGNVTGLLVENSNNSQGPIRIGGQGQGLHTLLTNINILNYAGPTGSVMNSTIFDATRPTSRKPSTLISRAQLGPPTLPMAVRTSLEFRMMSEVERLPIPTRRTGPGRLPRPTPPTCSWSRTSRTRRAAALAPRRPWFWRAPAISQLARTTRAIGSSCRKLTCRRALAA